MSNARNLYGITVEPLTDLNQRAHRGGGTETVETPSGEGLVEDQYEAHLKTMYVAYREPSAVKMAQLASKLEKAGFAEFAEKVDEVLAEFYSPEITKTAAETLKEQILSSIGAAKYTLDSAGFREWGIVHNLVSKPKILGQLQNIEKQFMAKTPNWQIVDAALSFLLNEELLYGTTFKIGEVDLENVLGAQFDSYLQNVKNIQVLSEKIKASGIEEDRAKLAPQGKPDQVYNQPYIDWIQKLNASIDEVQMKINRIQPQDEAKAHALFTPRLMGSIQNLNIIDQGIQAGKYSVPKDKKMLDSELGILDKQLSEIGPALDTLAAGFEKQKM